MESELWICTSKLYAFLLTMFNIQILEDWLIKRFDALWSVSEFQSFFVELNAFSEYTRATQKQSQGLGSQPDIPVSIFSEEEKPHDPIDF